MYRLDVEKRNYYASLLVNYTHGNPLQEAPMSVKTKTPVPTAERKDARGEREGERAGEERVSDGEPEKETERSISEST